MKLNLNRKYLHIETRDGSLYVYVDNKKWNHKSLSLKDLDKECNLGMITGRPLKFCLNLSKLIKELS